MALVACKECGNQVSTEAASCPKCGAPPPKNVPKKLTTLQLLGGLSVTLAAIILLVNVFDSDKAPPSTPPAQAPQPVAASEQPSPLEPATDDKKALPPPPLPHAYSVQRDDSYGYEAAISEDDRKNGIAAKPMMFIQYLGERDVAMQVRSLTGDGSVVIYDCDGDCKYYRVRGIVDGQLVADETMALADGSIAAEIFYDAEAGALQQHVLKKGKKAFQYWYGKDNQLHLYPIADASEQ